MIELLILLVCGGIISAGSFYLGWLMHRRLITNTMLAAVHEMIVELRLERINDNYLLYKIEGDEFVCQADTLDGVAINFSKNLGSQYVGILNYQDREMYIVDGKIQYPVTQ